MRLRTKLLITWGGMVVLLWAGTLWPVQQIIERGSANLASEAFAGARQSLDALQAERQRRMRQACRMLMNIPELRALIAEDNFEVSDENRASLTERLDGLTEIAGVTFVCVLDARGRLVAQNQTSPWKTLDGLRDYVAASRPARALVRSLYTPAENSSVPSDTSGYWTFGGDIYQVVGVPLIFSAQTDGAGVDGSLLMAAPLTDGLAQDLAHGHGGEISFIADHRIVASSLGKVEREAVQAKSSEASWPSEAAFEVSIGSTPFRSWMQPLADPPSGEQVGSVLIQSSEVKTRAVLSRVSSLLLVILVSGLLLAALASFLISGAITRPVRRLLKGVRRVGEGDLDHSLAVRGSDELGEVAHAFNEMLVQLRSRRELQRLVEESQAASRAKSQFLANMSHEIRTPLNGVIGISELLLRTPLNDRQKRYASLVKSSAEVLTTLINDVLDFSKIEAGKMELETIRVDPRTLVEDIAELMAPKAFGKGLDFVCDVAREVPDAVLADPTRLRQILINLVSNAIKFTSAGSVTLQARAISHTPTSIAIRFAVIDTGVGIPQDRRDRLFKSFSQVDASTTRRFGGTGLGLAIAKQLSELMGGSVEVESEPGRGSTFACTLTLQRLNTESVPREAPIPSLDGKYFLLSDLAEGSARTLAARLVELGAVCWIRTSTRDIPGPSELQAGELVVITAAANSEELERRVRANGYSRTVVMLKAIRGEEVPTVDDLRRAGFRSCITLPLRREQIVSALREAFGGDARSQQIAPVESNHTSPASAARILLAEDNEVNQIVVTDMLAAAGYRCDVVSNGKLAVQAVAEREYDLVLMDCQMPEMDGMEASFAIRLRERDSGSRRVPIIALTAHAAGEERQRCLDAGMDDHCTKPIDSRRLLEAIEPHLKRIPAHPVDIEPASGLPTTHETPASSDATPSPVDFAALVARCSGKETLATRVLEQLAAQASQACAQAGEMLLQHDAAAVARVAHGLKGAAGMASASGLQRVAAELERLGKAGDLDTAKSAMEELTAEVRRYDEYVRNILAAKTPRPQERSAP